MPLPLPRAVVGAAGALAEAVATAPAAMAAREAQALAEMAATSPSTLRTASPRQAMALTEFLRIALAERGLVVMAARAVLRRAAMEAPGARAVASALPLLKPLPQPVLEATPGPPVAVVSSAAQAVSG